MLISRSITHNGRQYAEAGFSKLQPVKPLRILVNVQKYKIPTSPGLRILRVVCWCSLFKVNPLQVFTNLIFYLNQSALTLQRSTNLFCFCGLGNPKTALKGG